LAYKVRITEPAKRDAHEYAAYILDEHQSGEAARKWLLGLYDKIKKLSSHPSRFAVIPEAEELGYPYRSFVYFSHRIVYAVHESEKVVVVHRIYHGARRPLTGGEI
jgi:plasmid stabilization system protein ParE